MAEDFRIRTSWPSSHKRRLVQRRIGKAGVLAVMDLWAYCASSKPDGDLSGMSNEAIAVACDWDGDADELIAALTVENFELLDGAPGSYKIHDWDDHNPYVSGEDDRKKSASLNAMVRHHRDGRHTGTPRDGCPMCARSAPAVRKPKSAVRPQCGSHENSAIRNAPDPDPDPSPYPLPDPDPDPDLSHASHALPTRAREQGLEEFTTALADAGIAIQISPTQMARYAKLHPITQHERDYALSRAAEKNAKSAGFVLGVIEGERKRASEVPDQPPARAPPDPRGLQPTSFDPSDWLPGGP